MTVKLINQQFNPLYFLEHGTTTYTVEQRYKTGLKWSSTDGLWYSINRIRNHYSPNWLGAVTWIGKAFSSLDTLDVDTYRFSDPSYK